MRPCSVPVAESVGEKLWQPCGANQRLCSRNVVGDASPLHRAKRTNRRTVVAAIPQHPARSYVTVTWLPNGTDIDE